MRVDRGFTLCGSTYHLRTMRADTIINAVALEYGIEPEEIKGSGRRQRIADARTMSVRLCSELITASPTELGRMFTRTHGTMIAALRQAENLLQTDRNFASTYYFILNQLKQ